MIMMDAFVELSHKMSNDSHHESQKKVNPNIEVSKASNINNTVAQKEFPISVENTVSSKPTIHAADNCLQPQPLSYAALLQKPDVATNLMGEALHNLNDGIAIATAFSLSWESGMCLTLKSFFFSFIVLTHSQPGIAIFAAVIIHEIPQVCVLFRQAPWTPLDCPVCPIDQFFLFRNSAMSQSFRKQAELGCNVLY
jgi:zinc transporter ZupT